MVLTGDDERDGGREVLSTSQGELAGNKTSSRHFVVCLCLAGYSYSGSHQKEDIPRNYTLPYLVKCYHYQWRIQGWGYGGCSPPQAEGT